MRKLNMKKIGTVMSGSLIAVLSSGCGLAGFETSKMNFEAEKVFACPAGNTSSDCAGVAHGSLLQPGDGTGSVPTTGGGANGIINTLLGGGANGSIPTAGMGGANGSVPTTGMSGANGSVPTTGMSGANGSVPTTGMSGANGSVPTAGMSGASGSVPTTGMSGAGGSVPTGSTSSSSGHLPTGGHTAGSSFPTGGSNAGSSFPTGGSGAGSSFPTGGSNAGSSFPTAGSGAGSSFPTGGSNAGSSFPTGDSGANGNLPTGGSNAGSSLPTYSTSGTQLTVNPRKVCGPNVSTDSQSFLKTLTGGVKAVLYKIKQAQGGTVVQAWDSPSDQTSLLSKLKQFQPFSLNLNQPLAAGDYSLVVYDAQRESAPYPYDWTQGETAVAPIQDSVAHNIDPWRTFSVASDGSVTDEYGEFNVLYSTQGDPECVGAGSIDPLVIRVSDANDPLLMSSVEKGVYFDILGASAGHTPKLTSWIQTASYMFLVLPKDGQVNGIDQMFGNGSQGPDGQFAANGFEALAKFDSNHDGVIDARDAVFSHLRLWSDTNHDGISQASEMYTLDQMGIVSLSLSYDPSFSEMDQFGNKAQYKSAASKASGGAYLLFDLWLQMKQ